MKNKKTTRKSRIRWAIEALVLIVSLSVVLIVAGKALRAIAIAQIAELLNAQIKTDLVDIDWDGSVYIQELAIRTGDPHDYDDTILRARSLYARFSPVSLLLLQPRLREITVNDFVFDIQYDLDANQWNFNSIKMKKTKPGSAQVPTVHLTNGTVKYSQVSKGRFKTIAAIPLDAELVPAQGDSGGYQFRVTTADSDTLSKNILKGLWQPGTITFTGGISFADIPTLERLWRVSVLAVELKYDPDNNYSLKLEAKKLEFSHKPTTTASEITHPGFLKLGPINALQKLFNRYQPQGGVDISIESKGNLNSLARSSLSGKLYCTDVSVRDVKFPYSMERIKGLIEFTEKSYSMNQLSARHGDVNINIDSFSKNYGPDREARFRMTSKNMILDDDLYNALDTKSKKSFSRFSPTGLVAIDYHRSLAPGAGKVSSLRIDLLDVDAKYNGFPYPLNSLTGELLLDKNSVTFSKLLAKAHGHTIEINGQIAGTNTDKPTYDISIEADNILLDSTLKAALPKKHAYLLDGLNMSGLIDARIKVYTPRENLIPASFIANISLKDALLRSNHFPILVSDVNAEVVFEPNSIKIKDFTGLYETGSIQLAGKILPNPKNDQTAYDLSIDTNNINLTEEFINALPETTGKIIAKIRPSGKFKIHTDISKASGRQSPDYKITVDCLGSGIDPEPYPYPLKDITGTFIATPNQLIFENIT
ncbi:MAG: hypothetical protein ACYST9_01805, partial [Planctomycetota bacterium]